jgi:hypothetical protein
MTDTRLKRRIVGALSKRLREARLDEVEDPRDPRGRRWKLGTLLGAALLGLVAGCRSLLQVEALTEDLSPATRQRFGLTRRLPDTTLHNLLWQLQPQQVLPVLHRVVRAAHRRRALSPDELPFGVVSLDGKSTAVPACDDYYAQRQSQHEGQCLGLVRTISAVLTSSPARPYLHVTPVPASTNEMGIFGRAFDELMSVYSRADLFRVVTYDAGACSKDNAQHVRSHGLHYVFGLKGSQPTMLDEAQRLLAARTAEHCDAQSEDFDHGTVTRRIWLSDIGSGYDGWESLRTVARVQTETRDATGKVIKCEERYAHFQSAAAPAVARPMAANHPAALAGRNCASDSGHGLCRGPPSVGRGLPPRYRGGRHPAADCLHAAEPISLRDATLRRSARRGLAATLSPRE